MGGTEVFQRAWDRRAGDFDRLGAVRVFHGPTEGEGPSSAIAIERFASRDSERFASRDTERFSDAGDDHYWIFEWGDSSDAIRVAADFLRARGAKSAVALRKPHGKVPSESAEILFGEPPAQLDVAENGLRFRIRFQETRHPGLFLDHEPLRQWLRARARGTTVLNTFAYTGSLSVACGAGEAAHVTTLDLSRPTIEWAKENWELNGLPADRGDFIFGDYFEWLPKFAKRGRKFDVVILDPPSFSRGKKGTFSTSKDLVPLHALALDVLGPGGMLVTSINSENVPRVQFRGAIEAAAGSRGVRLRELREISAPPSFPGADYLKGWVFQAAGR